MHRATCAFTLLETLAVVAILGVLVALSFPALEKIRPAAERVVCMNNLRNLRAAFGGYASEGWPQIPSGIALGSMAEQRWWLEKTEKELGLSKSAWQCPDNPAAVCRRSRERPPPHSLLAHALF